MNGEKGAIVVEIGLLLLSFAQCYFIFLLESEAKGSGGRRKEAKRISKKKMSPIVHSHNELEKQRNWKWQKNANKGKPLLICEQQELCQRNKRTPLPLHNLQF